VIFAFIEAKKAELNIAVACRVLGVSESGFYAWRTREPSARARADAELMARIRQIHAESRETYGSPRMHSELTLGDGLRIGENRVARLMRLARLKGVDRRRRFGCTKRDPQAEAADDLVQRDFTVTEPNRLWVADVTQHRAWDGWVYLSVVIDAFSRRVVGWSIADHLRAELVCDAFDMAVWQRKPAPGAIHHSDHGSQYTSWAFGTRLRQAGILGSMGSIGDCFDNSMAESFFATLQTELLDRHSWKSRKELARAIFEFVEAWYNPRRRHSSIGQRSPVEYEQIYFSSRTEDAA